MSKLDAPRQSQSHHRAITKPSRRGLGSGDTRQISVMLQHMFQKTRDYRRSHGMTPCLKRLPVLLATLVLLTAGSAEVRAMTAGSPVIVSRPGRAFAQLSEKALAAPDQLRQECE